MTRCKSQPNQTAQGVPHKRDARDAQLLQKVFDQLYLRVKRIAVRDVAGIAEPPQIDCIGAIAHRDRLHGGHPVPPRPDPAMQKYNRRAAAQHLVVHNLIVDYDRAHLVRN